MRFRPLLPGAQMRQGRNAARLSERSCMAHIPTMTSADKSALRKQARQRRKALAHPDIAAMLAGYASALGLSPGAIVGGYHALLEEADPALLLKALATRGCR